MFNDIPHNTNTLVEPEASDEEEGYGSDEGGGWSPRSPQHHFFKAFNGNAPSRNRSEVLAANVRIRNDLRQVKEDGFRVGHLGNLLNGGQDGFVTISCRVSKLGISEEALQAWHLEPSQYFLLIIRYTEGYKSLDYLTGSAMNHGHSAVQIRTGLSEGYKVAIDQAIAAFAQLEDKSKSSKLISAQNSDPNKNVGLGRLFIGRPLDELLNDRLIPLLRYRLGMGFGWSGAEQFFNDHQGRNLTSGDGVDAKYWAEDASSQREGT